MFAEAYAALVGLLTDALVTVPGPAVRVLGLDESAAGTTAVPSMLLLPGAAGASGAGWCVTGQFPGAWEIRVDVVCTAPALLSAVAVLVEAVLSVVEEADWACIGVDPPALLSLGEAEQMVCVVHLATQVPLTEG